MKPQSQQGPAQPYGYFLLMKNKLCLVVTLAITFLGAGCGTINTVLRDDSVSRRNLSQVKSPCESISRIYSGLSYNFCTLRGKLSRATPWMGAAPQLVLVDLVLSGVLDSLF